MVCQLLGGALAWLVQISLGIGALGFLSIKYYCEKNRRPYKIWLFDVSKQVIGICIAHLWNMLFAYLLAQHGDQCETYFMNYIIDNTIGIVMNCGLIYVLNKVIKKYDWIYLETGKYLRDNEVKAWSLQLLVWLFIITIVKFVLFVAFIYPLRDILIIWGNWILSPVDNDNLELIIVMVLVPLVCNISQFLIQDKFLKHNRDSFDSEQVEQVEHIGHGMTYVPLV